MSTRTRRPLMDESITADMAAPVKENIQAPKAASSTLDKKNEKLVLLPFRVTEHERQLMDIERAKRGEKYVDIAKRLVDAYIKGKI